MKHDCPIPGCEQRIPTTLLMCTAHWLAVPASLRRDVNRTWRTFRRLNDTARVNGLDQDVVDALNAYRDATEVAISTVTASELPCV